MKKISLILSASALIALASCSSKKEGGGDGMSEGAKKNMDANTAIIAMFETKDFSKLGDYIAADAVDHAGEKGDVKGLDSIKASMESMSKMMTVKSNKVVKTLADDEYVMSWLEGTSVADVDMPEWGMKKGVESTMHSVEVSKYNKDHKVTEHWSFMDMNDMMKMMAPMMQNMNNMPHADADTTHK